MKFRTPIEITTFDSKIEYTSRLLSIGSCFADAVGGRLSRAKFCATVNPTGVLFNPASICNTLQRFENKEFVCIADIRQSTQGYFHYDFHSSLSGATPEECVANINRAIELGHNALEQCDWLIITLGTAWVYELVESGKIVANCHKQPNKEFRRRRLSTTEVVELLESTLSKYLGNKKIIITLSPVRHLGDGLAENSLSKATLRVAIDELVGQHPESIFYFPAYEIFVDDLRDYRFYGDDMVHPSTIGVDYVWDKFCDVVLSLDSRELMPRVMNVVRAAEHRPINPLSESHQKFCASQLRAIDSLADRVEMEDMRQYFTFGADF